MRLRDSIEAERTLWILVRDRAQAVLAAPVEVPPDKLLVGSEGRAPATLDEALSVGHALLSTPDFAGTAWTLIVSIPGGLDPARNLEQQLLRDGFIPLTEEEQQDVVATGMEVPFGEWADPRMARLYARRREL